MSRVLAFLLIALMAHEALPAQQQPIVRAAITPESVSIGESAELRVTVLVPTWFASPPVFPQFEIANAITRLPPNSSFPTSERVGAGNWSGIVRLYRIYPLLGASYRLSGQTMQIEYADPGSQPLSAEVMIPAIELRATVAAGAENLDPYLAGRDLRLTREIEGNTDALQAGDAVVIVYTAEVDGLPAIFLPPLAPDLQLEGVSIYADTAVVEDGPPARRTEKLTLVFDAGGDFEIPASALDWWHTDTATINTASVSAQTISVTGPPAPQKPIEAPLSERLPVIGLLVVLLVVLRFLLRHAAAIRGRWLAYHERRKASEAYAFGQLRIALRSGDPHAAHKALLKWLERFKQPMNSRDFARKYGNAELMQQLERLSSGLYSGSSNELDLRRLERQLVSSRRRWRHGLADRHHAVLPPLNP